MSNNYYPQSQSYQDKDFGHNNSSNSSSRNLAASPQYREYQERLMFFVYQAVKEAFTKKDKNSLHLNDLNSVSIMLSAEKKADEELRRSLI